MLLEVLALPFLRVAYVASALKLAAYSFGYDRDGSTSPRLPFWSHQTFFL